MQLLLLLIIILYPLRSRSNFINHSQRFKVLKIISTMLFHSTLTLVPTPTQNDRDFIPSICIAIVEIDTLLLDFLYLMFGLSYLLD